MADEVSPDPTPPVVPARAKESAELAGFIVSLSGIMVCGFLAPVGMMMCYAEMRRKPNKFAKAGFIIGLIGTILLVVSLVVVAYAANYVIEQYNGAHRIIEQMEATDEADKLVKEFAAKNKRLPSEQETQQLFSPLGDAGKSLSYQPGESGTYTITQAGADGELGTDDDLEIPGYAHIPHGEEE